MEREQRGGLEEEQVLKACSNIQLGVPDVQTLFTSEEGFYCPFLQAVWNLQVAGISFFVEKDTNRRIYGCVHSMELNPHF